MVCMDFMDLTAFCLRKAVKLKHSLTTNARNQGISSHIIDLVIYDILVSAPEQSGTKPNLVAKIWLPTLVAIYNGLPKLVAKISSHIHHLVNTGLDVGSLVKWLPIKVATSAN